MQTDCCVALGGNQGDVEAAFQTCLDRMDCEHTRVKARSSIVRTEPIGSDAGDPFLNAAATVRTQLPASEFHAFVQSVESEFQQQAKIHWGPRPLDIDVVLCGDQVIQTPTLTVPHPACWYRRFVLDPLAEICPDTVHPVRGLTISQLRDRLLPRPFELAIAGGTQANRENVLAKLRELLPTVKVVDATEMSPSPHLVACLAVTRESQMGSIPPEGRLDVSQKSDVVSFLRWATLSALGND